MRRPILTLFCAAVWAMLPAQDMSRPWTFWYWMYGAVSPEGIRADLQAMKDVGLGGCYLMPIRGVAEHPEYGGTAQQLSPTFWRLVDLAFQQADSLGLQMGIHVCDGFALAGGPWITPAESMQKVVWTDSLVSVADSRRRVVALPHMADSHGYYEDIAAFAVECALPLPVPEVSGTIVRDDKGTFRSREPGYIQYSFAEPQTVRSLEVVPSGNNLQAQRLRVQASDDGVTFSDVRQLVPPRQGWQNTDYAYTYRLPATTARHFRFCWTPVGTEPGSEDLDAGKWAPTLKVKELRLSADDCIDQYEARNGSVWRIVTDHLDDGEPGGVAQTARAYPRIVPLTVENGAVDLCLPPGTWRILRMGHTTTGHTNATAGGGKGLECDKFSAEAVGKQIENWFGAFMQRPHADVVKYMHVDSWECGSQNWSSRFAEEFKTRRGYDLLPFLPVYAGVPMAGGEQVLCDVRLTINDLLQDVFFATVRKHARRYGVLFSAESVAPTMVSDGMEHYKNVDTPMGEFWLNSPTHDKPNDMMDAISAAHVYGKRVVRAEGFTEVRGVWDETPASIKPLFDRNLALGMNRLVFHVFTHNPWLDRKPGMTLDGIGLFFQRDQTWFPEAKAFVDYVTRCQQWMERGVPVVDIAVYTGEEMPRRALTPDRLVPMLPGLFGPGRVASEQARLANHGLPMTESPVGVNHAAGILDLKDWVNPLHGYHYDSMNPDGLARWVSEMTGPKSLSTPAYRVLVVPQGALVSPKTWQQIDTLRSYGITVITEPCTSETLPGLPPDAVLPGGIDFAHSKNSGRHYYFICNQNDSVCTFRAKLRMKYVSAVIDPVNGNLLNCHQEQQGDYSCIDITLPAYGSVIVVSGWGFTDVWPKSQKRGEGRAIAKNPQWDITFLASGLHVSTRRLFDWSQSDDDRIRYYSGRVRYSTHFTMKKSELKHGTWWLRLPGLKDVGHVWMNGQDLGTVWTAPYEVELGKVIRKGKNTLTIEVVNTWHNALRGADQGKAPYDGIWTNAKYRTKGNRLLPSGLLQTPQLWKEQHGFSDLSSKNNKSDPIQ